MKILYVSPYSWTHPGGVKNHIKGIAREMIKKGHSVSVYAPDSGETPEGVGFISAGSSVPVPANRSIARVCLSPFVLSRTKRILRLKAFDVVHVHEPFVPLVSVSAVLCSEAKTIGTFHASAEKGFILYRLAQVFLRGLPGRVDHFTAVSGPANELANRYFPGDYEIVPNGVDTEFFRPVGRRPENFPGDGSPVVLFVGRAEPRKGIQILLESFRRLLSKIPECRLIIVGEGHSRQEYLTSYRLPDSSVTVTGFVPDEDLPAYYSSADVFCAPSLGGESFGLVLLEAMACGTPVVASDIPGYREVIKSTGGGILFKTGDVDSLSSALADILLDEEIRRTTRSVGLEKVKVFSWSSIAARVERIYMDC